VHRARTTRLCRWPQSTSGDTCFCVFELLRGGPLWQHCGVASSCYVKFAWCRDDQRAFPCMRATTAAYVLAVAYAPLLPPMLFCIIHWLMCCGTGADKVSIGFDAAAYVHAVAGV
jgi:hypothetical protein